MRKEAPKTVKEKRRLFERSTTLNRPPEAVFQKEKITSSRKHLNRRNSMPRLLPSESKIAEKEAGKSPAVTVNEKHQCVAATMPVPCNAYLSPTGSCSNTSSTSSSSAKKANFIRQKSLNRTMSTSVLRIKKKRSFWNTEKSGTQK